MGRLGLRRQGRGRAESRRLPRARPGRRVDLHHAERGGRAARVLQRLQPPRHAVRGRAGWPRARKVFVCPYHSWSYDLNGCLVGSPNVQEDETFDRLELPAAPDRRRGVRGVPVREPGRAAPAAAGAADVRGGDDHRVRALQDGRAARRRAHRLRGGGELEDRRRELQRVPALPDDPPRAGEGRAAVPVRRGVGRADPRRRQPDGRGRDELHDERGNRSCRSSPACCPRTTRCTTGCTRSRT